jgi:hypothetical protein
MSQLPPNDPSSQHPPVERHHVESYPAETAAPEIVPDPVRPEPGGNMQSDDVNVSMVAIIGVFAAMLLFLLIVMLQAWFYTWDDRERTAKSEPSVNLSMLRSQQLDQLKDYHWVNQANHVRGLPIERAMELETQRLAGEQQAVGPK